ncbi:hypothetical protein PBY51_017309 [Eleginops maclovinus]|nr:hypothetical protein PBY51_017309 [Eleginops maclovinus]
MLKLIARYRCVSFDIRATVIHASALDRQIEAVRGKLIAVTPREVGKVNPALRLKSTRGKRGSGGSLLCGDTGAKWYIPAYGTVQTTDGDSL